MTKNILKIDKLNGSLTIKNYPITLHKGTTRQEVGETLIMLYRSNIDYKNGTEWMFFEDIEFCECPCTLGLYFDEGKLTQIKINIIPFHLDRSQSGWTSNQSIDEEVSLTRFELKLQLGRTFGNDKEIFDWGEVWAVPDYHKSEMNAGIKYK